MGMIPELPITMLACAKIGAAHGVIFGGFSAEALRERINDAQAKFWSPPMAPGVAEQSSLSKPAPTRRWPTRPASQTLWSSSASEKLPPQTLP